MSFSWKVFGPKHVPPKGLEPSKMVSEVPEFFAERSNLPNTKPRIEKEYLDRDLHFQLENFEEHCKSFDWCIRNNDKSRGEVILSLFLTFFSENMETFLSHNVDLDFFIDTFKKYEFIANLRQIIQFQEEPLFDPAIYFLTQLVKCDERFTKFIAEYDLASAIIITLANFEGNERRIFKNLIHLELAVLPYHYILDSKYQDFLDYYQQAFETFKRLFVEGDIKQRMVCTVATFAEPIPDVYPDFLGVVIKELSAQNLKYAFLTVSQIIRKSPDFFLIIDELDIITQLFDFRRGTLRDNDALFPVIDFALALVDNCPEDYDVNEKVYSRMDFGEIRDGLNSTNPKCAIAALQFVDKTIPATISQLSDACGNFGLFMDSITTSLRMNNEEQLLLSLIVLRKLVQNEPVKTTQLFNIDFNEILVQLLKSDIVSYIDGIFLFFEELLDNPNAPIRNVSNFFLSLADSGINEPMNKLKVSQMKKKIPRRAREISTKIDAIEKKHREMI